MAGPAKSNTNAPPPAAQETPPSPPPGPNVEVNVETKATPEAVAEALSRTEAFRQGVSGILAALPDPEVTVVGSPMIYRLMAAVLGELPAIGKNQRNAAQGFNFQGIEDILDHLNPILARHGVFFAPLVLERLPEIRVTGKGNHLWTVHLHIQYTFYAPDGSTVVASSWGEGTDSGDKATSKAMTMAMKSCLRQVFAISDHEVADPDSEGEASRPADAAPPPEPLLSDEDRSALQEQIDGLSPAAAAKLKLLWIGQKGKLPALKAASDSHVPAILALISQAEEQAEAADRIAAAEEALAQAAPSA